MKKINIHGMTYLERLDCSDGWYYATDYFHGDLYEAEEIYKSGQPIKSNKLIFVHYPDGETVEPIKPEDGRYFGTPVYYRGELLILLVDFPKGEILVYSYCCITRELSVRIKLSLSEVYNCYNLMIDKEPLMLTLSSCGKFSIVYPEKREYCIGETETFLYRENDSLYFSAWYEDPEYREKLIVRDAATGEITESFDGGFMEMPDGQKWLLS